MVKRMSDDDVQDYVYSKLFGDLDGIEAHSMFDKEEGPEGMGAIEGTEVNAEPESHDSGGVKITVEPVMNYAKEPNNPSPVEEDEEDELKGIGAMSPLMSQLHGKR